MSHLDLLIIITVSVTALSLLLAIIGWIVLASLSSKTVLLEEEIEKKAKEFDAIRKEKSSNRHHTERTVSVIESPEVAETNQNIPQTEEPTAEDTIQIVRNVRGTFEKTEQFTRPIHPAPLPPQEDIGASYPPIEPEPALVATTSGRPMVVETAAQQESPYPPVGVTPPPPPPQYPPVSPRPPTAAGPVVLRLYSEATHDADFQALWKNLSALFETNPSPRVVIDLSGINYMYDKEMDYLEKIKYLSAGRNGSLEFIHCDRELRTLLSRRPELSSIVR
jgi:hypothetical protein